MVRLSRRRSLRSARMLLLFCVPKYSDYGGRHFCLLSLILTAAALPILTRSNGEGCLRRNGQHLHATSGLLPARLCTGMPPRQGWPPLARSTEKTRRIARQTPRRKPLSQPARRVGPGRISRLGGFCRVPCTSGRAASATEETAPPPCPAPRAPQPGWS